MAKVDIFGSPMVMAKNPWSRVGMAKKGSFYLRRAVPWDGRVGGYNAMRPAQKTWIEMSFIPNAREASREGRIYQECLREGYSPGTMAMNACRIKKLGQRLKVAPEAKPPEGTPRIRTTPRRSTRVPGKAVYTPEVEWEVTPGYRYPGARVY